MTYWQGNYFQQPPKLFPGKAFAPVCPAAQIEYFWRMDSGMRAGRPVSTEIIT